MGSVYLGSLLEICMLSGHKSNPSSGIVNVFQEFDFFRRRLECITLTQEVEIIIGWADIIA